jgi:putative heme iron utilization protein
VALPRAVVFDLDDTLLDTTGLEAEMLVGFADFSFYRIELKRAHLVAGFGRIVDLKPADILTPVDDAAELIGAEPDILAHMNADHAETCRLYATKLGRRVRIRDV